jgi:hypothetical protein
MYGLDGKLALKLLHTFFCHGPRAPCSGVVTAPTPSPVPGDSVAAPIGVIKLRYVTVQRIYIYICIYLFNDAVTSAKINSAKSRMISEK